MWRNWTSPGFGEEGIHPTPETILNLALRVSEKTLDEAKLVPYRGKLLICLHLP
jgi:hypothetical protein